MSEDRTPRTISLTSHEEGDETTKRRPSKRRKHPDADVPSPEQGHDAGQRKEREHVEDMDPRDRARMTAR